MVGAYRLGRLDELSADEVPYSGTLFEYKAGFFEALGPALEMGRSFVRPEYQRSPVGLVLLWKGIAKYLQKYPRYRHLLGLSRGSPAKPCEARLLRPRRCQVHQALLRDRRYQLSALGKHVSTR